MMRKTEGVRIGPISLATLISILLVAVLALLCVVTANAAQTMAERQANATSESFALDSCGQKILAQLDAELSSSGSLPQSDKKLKSIVNKVVDASSYSGFSASSKVSSEAVSFSIRTEDGKTLDAKVSQKNGSLSVDQWKLTSEQQGTEESLWSGSDDNQ